MGRAHVQAYGPGDTVEIVVDFLHKMRIKKVAAVFISEEKPLRAIKMSAVPRFHEVQDSAEGMRSFAVLDMVVSVDTPPGVYSLSTLTLTTYSGKPYQYAGEDLGSEIASFEVRPELDEPPVIERSAIYHPPS